ncbi:hypothetical protein GGG87_07615 [Streptococcus sp. zg-86]|uniref:Lipoprotein n=1 Tax=Streptococcus zhangguiae TaxID=2664091 RepID=A0A6I4RJ72_9STRE|nr:MULTISPECIES: hypothetical protein [unclassified Streptococcus]MTB64860.1 hypothetical protein [Streptococcus sp. zg-86]MTB91070.1 hypothetical protein [Streptococcus sp. zg-36]MWV56847.1 hypothetical protein [Streptococcus sp. zg-70]QTH48347.1 hypothetical protein J5M87_03210 [Streptococcus sp. zg-86]
MKHKLLIPAIILTLIGLLGCQAIPKLIPDKLPEVPLTEQADAYLIGTKSISAIQIHNDKLQVTKQTKHSELPWNTTLYPATSFDKRYLVFQRRKEEMQLSSPPSAIFSIDFETSQTQLHKTKYASTVGMGSSLDFFYTWYANTLTQFDKEGKEIQSKTFDDLADGIQTFNDTSHHIHLVAFAKDSTIHLLELDETNLSLISDQTLSELDGGVPRFAQATIIQGVLYASLHSILTKGATIPDNRLLVLDLQSMQPEFINLNEKNPDFIYHDGNRLFITHDSSASGTLKLCFSTLNLDTGETTFIDVSHILNNDTHEISTSHLKNFKYTTGGKLLFTVQNRLIYFDIEKQEVLDTLVLEESDQVISLWMK